MASVADDRRSPLNIPQSNGTVLWGGEQKLPIATETGAINWAMVAKQHPVVWCWMRGVALSGHVTGTRWAGCPGWQRPQVKWWVSKTTSILPWSSTECSTMCTKWEKILYRLRLYETSSSQPLTCCTVWWLYVEQQMEWMGPAGTTGQASLWIRPSVQGRGMH